MPILPIYIIIMLTLYTSLPIFSSQPPTPAGHRPRPTEPSPPSPPRWPLGSPGVRSTAWVDTLGFAGRSSASRNGAAGAPWSLDHGGGGWTLPSPPDLYIRR